MARKRVTREFLHDLIEREFRDSAGDHCLACRIPLPSYFAAGEGGVNWRMGAMDECSSFCHSIVQDIVERLSEQYEVTRGSRAAPDSDAAGRA